MPADNRSVFVDKKPAEMLTPLVDEEPKDKPFKVTCTAVDAEIAAVAVVIIIAVGDGAAETKLPDDAPLIATVGVVALLKNPEGYANVMKLPTGR